MFLQDIVFKYELDPVYRRLQSGLMVTTSDLRLRQSEFETRQKRLKKKVGVERKKKKRTRQTEDKEKDRQTDRPRENKNRQTARGQTEKDRRGTEKDTQFRERTRKWLTYDNNRKKRVFFFPTFLFYFFTRKTLPQTTDLSQTSPGFKVSAVQVF